MESIDQAVVVEGVMPVTVQAIPPINADAEGIKRFAVGMYSLSGVLCNPEFFFE